MAIADDAGKLIGRVNPQKGMVCTREDEDLTHEVVEHPTGGRGSTEYAPREQGVKDGHQSGQAHSEPGERTGTSPGLNDEHEVDSQPKECASGVGSTGKDATHHLIRSSTA
jgi:hypothetical protein